MANYPIIDKIHSCDDYRALSTEELRGLPAEIRSFLVGGADNGASPRVLGPG